MKYALFLGCTIPARARNYELSARRVAEKTGVELVDMENFICCGFPTKAGDMQASLLMAAYNLALAQQQNLDVCCPVQFLYIGVVRSRPSFVGKRGRSCPGQ